MKKEFNGNGSLPFCINMVDAGSDNFVKLYMGNAAYYENLLQKEGAIKFRYVNIASSDDFQKIIRSISTNFMDYIDGNSPRTKVASNIYTSTEYDKSLVITMHNELSYSAKWPNKLFFSCLKTAETGGETLLADGRAILREMDKAIVDEIQAKGIVYIRNLNSGDGFGPSWQDTFETRDKQLVEKYCKDYAIDFEWHETDQIALFQKSKGIIRHRLTGEAVWFNQIQQFHPCHLGEEIYNTMLDIFSSPIEFPMYVKFGDGTDIPENMVQEILDTIDRVTIAPGWEANELLIIDNELVTHGRNPFTGDRKVLVAMSN